jgi:ABC-type amino acid transport system permease subunit
MRAARALGLVPSDKLEETDMPQAFTRSPLAVETGVVAIVVAGAVVAVVLIAALSMRGRQKRRGAARRAERDRDVAQRQAERDQLRSSFR